MVTLSAVKLRATTKFKFGLKGGPNVGPGGGIGGAASVTIKEPPSHAVIKPVKTYIYRCRCGDDCGR